MVIKCNNTRNENHEIIQCGRYLLSVSEGVINFLKSNPTEKIITRCPTCPQNTRWAAIHSDPAGRIVWETIKRPEFDTKDDEIIFDDVINTQQVG